MKFGKNLQRNQVPEWSSDYINYKGIKKLIKGAAQSYREGEEADLAEILFSLDRNLESVDAFYNKKYGEASRRLKLLSVQHADDSRFRHVGNKEEVEDTIAALLELRGLLRKLQWYGDVNRRGFMKILKKLDKKVPSACAQQQYMLLRVNPLPFASNLGLTDDVTTVNLWLSRLGDLKFHDDQASEGGSKASRSTSLSLGSVPQDILDATERAARQDDRDVLLEALGPVSTPDDNRLGERPQQFLLHVLQRAISSNARMCIAELLARLDNLVDENDINKRNCIHRLVIALGRDRAMRGAKHDAQSLARREITSCIVPAGVPSLQSVGRDADFAETTDGTDPTAAHVSLLPYILDHLRPSQYTSLVAKDEYGRIPLHYAAQYGFVTSCQVILQYMQKWDLGLHKDHVEQIALPDNDEHTPLHLSVIGGHAKTAEVLLDAWINTAPQRFPYSGELLITATRANFPDIVTLLISAKADVNYRDEQGETAMHVAARFGYEECARSLLVGSTDNRIDLDLCERTFGWTALHVASVDGHVTMAELLIREGAMAERKDYSGWTAKEHAALRGHLDIVRLLARYTPLPTKMCPPDDRTAQIAQVESLHDRSSLNNNKEKAGAARSAMPVKSFGHRYLQGDSLVLVSLGSMDQRKTERPVDLDNVPLAEAHATQLDTALSVVVSASEARGDPTVIDLPVQENISTEPISFFAKDVTKVKILFDIIPTYSGSEDKVVGRGVAILSSIKATIGSGRMNLQGDVSVPIIAAKNLEFIGTINFNFIVITPFEHPNMLISESQMYWKSTTPMVIGHRGMGKNVASRKSLQLGENTMQSFIAAANLGASYVEFDVQLTKDHVPVIYHDFLVSETGIDAPVHTLTLEQFLHVNEAQTSRSSRADSPLRGDGGNTGVGSFQSDPPRRLQRAQSLGSQQDKRKTDMPERMKHTRDFKLKGFKGNSWGNFIQEPFTTLEEMLRKLPPDIGFNIEMKYPMLWESEEQEMDTYAVELNSFVDTVLKMVYDHGKQRDILFSSFNPDICLLLSFKQPTMPVLFLTDAGTSEVGDIRASSLQEAIRFASRWNLLGVVSAAEPLVACPRLVRVVKESGLVCVSYGTLNNDPANVKLQTDEGIDAVIVDSVLAIRQGLTASTSSDNAQKSRTSDIPGPLQQSVDFIPDASTKIFNINGVTSSAFQHSAVV